ncbi:trichohyalin-like isoform X15 [Mytilus edulis]|uniref:trichohyalin-like isoform X15 n=1 Tax=Mytilus edulis TaxID=6550 RepID=UPI0039EF9B80
MTNFDNYIVHQLKDLQELRTRNFEGILASPRNLGQAPAQPLVWQDFRFKGYPDKSFQAPKVPKYKRLSLDLMNTERDDQYFGKTTHFDTDRYSVHPRQITKRAAARKNQSSQQNPLKISPHVDDKREEYPIRDPLGTLTDRSENRRYRIRDPYGDLTEEHKYKLQREMRDIEEDRKQRGIIDKLRTEERQEERQKFYEDLYRQRQDKEMLTNYYPWGKPGGGAPKPDNRKQKFLETDFEGSPTPSYRERMHAPYYRPIYRPFVDSFGKPGGGAPLRTQSGNIKTSIIGDMLIRFQEKDRQAVEERFRYNEDRGEQERYHQELAKQKNDQELRRQEDRLDNLQRELETLKTDQFGKPGGGAPNRTTSESFTERREPMPSMESPRRAPPTFRNNSYDDIGRSMNAQEKLTRVNREVLPLYHPFGRSGGGAPVKDNRGKIVTQLQGNLLMENYKYQDSSYDDNTRKRARAKEYYDFLRGQEEEQRRNKQEIEWHMKAPIGELASIMGSKNVGKPVKDPYTGELRNHHLGNSDVTLQKMNYQPKAETEKKKYHEDLSQLADERMRYRQLNRLKENQEGMLHQHTMDAMWGRPGGGAPKGYNLRKFNLESTLHHPTKDGNPFTQNDDNYSPRFQPNKYVRSTITSTHANLYEYPEHLKDKNYALSEPYATY